MRAYERGNGEHTVDFMKSLQDQNQGKRIALIWDGASYHRSQETKDFLAKTNDGKEESQWSFKCILFAPHSPEQNPVEDVWLQTKNFLRRCWLWTCVDLSPPLNIYLSFLQIIKHSIFLKWINIHLVWILIRIAISDRFWLK
jgi:transposase